MQLEVVLELLRVDCEFFRFTTALPIRPVSARDRLTASQISDPLVLAFSIGNGSWRQVCNELPSSLCGGCRLLGNDVIRMRVVAEQLGTAGTQARHFQHNAGVVERAGGSTRTPQ